MKVHLDTDIGGDMDDLCALAMLLCWPALEITGITTVADDGGRRAGYVRHVLALAGRADIPVAAGADVTSGSFRYAPAYPPDEENWGSRIPPAPGPVEGALNLLRQSAEQGATLIGIGQFTNFALLARAHPGLLQRDSLFLMGGYIFDPPPGYPIWQSEDDYNLQLDAASARFVLEQADPTIIPLAMSCQTALRRADLLRLARAGSLGALIARQAEFCARTDRFDEVYGARYAGLPADMINFQHDGLACAIALGWRDGVTISEVPLRVEMREGWVYEVPDPTGRPLRVVTQIDGAAFNAFWLDMVCGDQQ